MMDERLEEISDLLDISEEVKSEIQILYQEITRHLGRKESEIHKNEPDIYSQGSFRIGTVVKPCGRGGEVDVDIVCCLQIQKVSVSQKDLKEMIGRELKKFKYEGAELTESRRCWVLNFKKNIHIDILPSIPNANDMPDGILLTDKDLRLWQMSAPRKYSEWYLDICKNGTEELKNCLDENQKAEIEKIPEISFKSPLQRATQILKRLRDVRFKNDQDNRPASVVLTTLLAIIDQPRMGLFEKLEHFCENVQKQIKYENSRYHLYNPVVPDENFIDKWNEYPSRRIAFLEWICDLRKTLNGISLNQDAAAFDQLLEIEELINDTEINPSAGALALLNPANVPSATSTAHAVNPPWVLASRACKCKIKGTVYSENKKLRMWGVSHRPIPKKHSIKFVMETSCPRPFNVYWQIINTGKEALAMRQLRGNIENTPSISRWETTAYRGTHFVKGYVVKNGEIVASAQHTVRIM